MVDLSAFERTCTAIEQGTSLTTLEARGTVRLALKQAGFDARRVAIAEMAVVVRRVLPAELVLRGIEDGELLCEHIAVALEHAAGEPEARESPEEVFRRLGQTGLGQTGLGQKRS